MMSDQPDNEIVAMRTARLVARLRSQDWLAVVTELVIVVAGILIALQVSNWNQARVDHARAQSYYRRIQADLATDRQNIGHALAYWQKVGAYGQKAIAYGETGKQTGDSDWQTDLAYYQASQILPFELISTTFDEMRSDGDLSLIANEKLRRHLVDYYRLSGNGITSMILHHDPVYRKQIRGLTPWPVQEYIWNHCFRETRSVMTQQLLKCPSPVSASEAAAILTSYRQSPTLLDNLRTWMSTLRISAIVLDNLRLDNQRLTAAVAAAQK